MEKLNFNVKQYLPGIIILFFVWVVLLIFTLPEKKNVEDEEKYKKALLEVVSKIDFTDLFRNHGNFRRSDNNVYIHINTWIGTYHTIKQQIQRENNVVEMNQPNNGWESLLAPENISYFKENGVDFIIGDYSSPRNNRKIEYNDFFILSRVFLEYNFFIYDVNRGGLINEKIEFNTGIHFKEYFILLVGFLFLILLLKKFDNRQYLIALSVAFMYLIYSLNFLFLGYISLIIILLFYVLIRLTKETPLLAYRSAMLLSLAFLFYFFKSNQIEQLIVSFGIITLIFYRYTFFLEYLPLLRSSFKGLKKQLTYFRENVQAPLELLPIYISKSRIRVSKDWKFFIGVVLSSWPLAYLVILFSIMMEPGIFDNLQYLDIGVRLNFLRAIIIDSFLKGLFEVLITVFLFSFVFVRPASIYLFQKKAYFIDPVSLSSHHKALGWNFFLCGVLGLVAFYIPGINPYQLILFFDIPNSLANELVSINQLSVNTPLPYLVYFLFGIASLFGFSMIVNEKFMWGYPKVIQHVLSKVFFSILAICGDVLNFLLIMFFVLCVAMIPFKIGIPPFIESSVLVLLILFLLVFHFSKVYLQEFNPRRIKVLSRFTNSIAILLMVFGVYQYFLNYENIRDHLNNNYQQDFFTLTIRQMFGDIMFNEFRSNEADGLVRSGAFISGNLNSLSTNPVDAEWTMVPYNYQLDTTEVTISDYHEFMDFLSTSRGLLFLDSLGLKHSGLKPSFWDSLNHVPSVWLNQSMINPDKLPIVGVSWSAANAYCIWKKKRLPTESEWEKASRGIAGNPWPWGTMFANFKMMNIDQDTVSNHGYDKFLYAAPVGSHIFDKSVYHHKDLGGNVSEWGFDSTLTSRQIIFGHNYRTSGDVFLTDNNGYSIQSAKEVDYADQYIGFRCLCEIKDVN